MPFAAKNPPKEGFVLVATILLIALATILVVTSAMMARVERKSAANSAKVDQARGNALFALDVALNQLQTAAGPDQRVTARAEILDTNSTSLVTNTVKQPLWTGVWRTGTNGLDIVDSGTPQREISLGSINPTMNQKITNATWLVSGFGSLNPSTFTGNTNSPNATAAVLAKNLGTNADPVNVLVPLVPIASPTGTTSVTNGAYAYWISDEGVKAKINKSDPTLGVDPTVGASTNQFHFLVPQAAAVHKSSTLFGNTDLRTQTNDLPKITTLQSLANIAGLSGLSGTNAAKIAADFTTSSWGILADMRRGGLRKDLTAALESTNVFNTLATTYGYGSAVLYKNDTRLTVPAPTGLANSGVTDGLPWLSLYSYYNTYKSAMPLPAGVALSGAPTTPSTTGSPASLPLQTSPRVVSTRLDGKTVKLGGLVPEVIASRLDIGLSSDLDGTNWLLRLHYFPQLVLYNPYSVRISAANFQFQRNFGAFVTGTTSVNITVTVSGTPLPSVVLNQAQNAGRFTLRTAVGEANLEPGETRVFGLASDRAASPNTPLGAITFNDLVSATNSLSADWSQFCDLPGFTGTANSNAVVTVSISDRRLRSQHTDTFVVPNNLKWPWNDGTVRFQGGDGADVQGLASPWPSSLTIEAMNGNIYRLTGFFYRRKGVNVSTAPTLYNGGTDIIAPFHGNAPHFSPFENKTGFTWGEVYMSNFGTLYGTPPSEVLPTQRTPPNSPWETSYGHRSAGSVAAIDRRILRDVPNQPLVSLGQFMHMPANIFLSIGAYEFRDMGSMFVGGSLANPFVPTSQSLLNNATGTYLSLDDSFLVNEALFDRFFFSTVPPASLTAPPGTAYPSAWIAFNAANPTDNLTNRSVPLLNSRLKPYFKNQTNAPAMANLRDMDKAAANLLLDGAFNINSTSVAAWKAFLGGLSGNDLRLYNVENRTASTVSTTISGVRGTTFSRFWSADGKSSPNIPWSGLRVLSDPELDDLANKIVAQIKLRGPFLSLSDFLNRRLGASSNLTLAGALQAAIDSTDPDINSAAKALGSPINVAGRLGLNAPVAGRSLPVLNTLDGAGNTLNSAVGMPGYLMQQDIVQAIAPAIAARSDTFVIRTYGEVRNPRTGEVESRAWAEAVVQRLPDYVNPSADDAHVFPPSHTDNQTFGRRFEIVSFRWLHPNEI